MTVENEKKMTVGVVFGGKSGEHEVSLNSAFHVIEAIDKEKYDVIMIAITKEGQWCQYSGEVANVRNNTWWQDEKNVNCDIGYMQPGGVMEKIDIFFPVLHGPNGEDGTIQGFFTIFNKPYVGCGVFASAVGMDKVAAKVLFEKAGIPVVPYISFYTEEWTAQKEKLIAEMEELLSYPIFIKPVNMGSSVGISKVKTRRELEEAVENALLYDTKILAEQFIDGREIECAVLGNFHATASTPGEIIPSREFYDYESKYMDGDASRVVIPAEITKEQAELVRKYACEAFRAIDGSGLCRADFFIDKANGNLYINEVNTMPGFTEISMYPKMMMHDGCSYAELIEKLIELGLEKHEQYARKKTER